MMSKQEQRILKNRQISQSVICSFQCTSEHRPFFGKIEKYENCNSLYSKELQLRPAGLEPATYGLEIRCSIQLSYGRLEVG
jgi:hypothetical protein